MQEILLNGVLKTYVLITTIQNTKLDKLSKGGLEAKRGKKSEQWG